MQVIIMKVMIMKKNKPHNRIRIKLLCFFMLTGLWLTPSAMAQIVACDSFQVNSDSKAISSNNDSLLVKSHIIQELEDSISILQKRVNELEILQQGHLKQIAFADTCIVRQCNNALNAPYDEKRTHSAISAFDRINSTTYREQMLPLRQLLVDYDKYFSTIMDILQRADADRDMRNPFSGKETADRYINEIRQTEYYRTIMQAEWIIPYINRLIDHAISRLKSNNPGERQTINLKDLLNP